MKFFVPGIPVAKGSMRAFLPKGRKFPIVTNADAKTKPWEASIRASAIEARGVLPERSVWTGAVTVRVIFRMPRLKSHFGASGLKPSAPKRYDKKPDLDKLLRAVLDALTGVIYVDDAQVDEAGLRKRYVRGDETPGVEIEVF